MMLGECIEEIGDEKLHGRAKRQWTSKDGSMTGGLRLPGYGYFPTDYSILDPNGTLTHFPLWSGDDFRQNHGGPGSTFTQKGGGYDWRAAQKANGQLIHYTGYHFHNFFDDTSAIRHKVS